MEKYLPRCLDSVLAPEILDKIEIIVVNDGSTDNSLSIMQQYKDKFPESIEIINKSNGHYGSCINAALKIATGKYFRPLDPDDWFDSNAFIQYIKVLQDTNADMVFTNFSYEYAGGKSNIAISPKITKNIIPGKKYDLSTCDFKVKQAIMSMIVMHTMTFRTQMLVNMNFQCSEGLYYVDTEYCFYPTGQVKTFVYTDCVLYKYYIERNGQSMSDASLVRNKEHIFTIICRMIKHIESTPNISVEQECSFKKILRLYYITILLKNKKNKEDDAKLKTVDSLLKKINRKMYEETGQYRRLTVPIVRLWREKGIYYGETKTYKMYRKIRELMKF
jgi:glycosyltransferase involved in cell wall biosynthesis